MTSQHTLAKAEDGTAGKEGPAPAVNKATPPLPRRNFFLRCLSFAGVASLTYLLGAAVIYFELPTSSFLRRAFEGGVAWYEVKGTTQHPEAQGPLTVGRIDRPDKTCDGFTLCMYGGNTRAVLVNMAGKIVHEWHVPFSSIWPSLPDHLHGRIDDAMVYFNDGHLYPNGDLLVVVEGPADANNPSNGFGLIKMDKDSNVLWNYAHNCHHDLDVAEDGTIYVLVNEIVKKMPRGLEHIPTPCMVDVVHVISPEGKWLKTIPILEAFNNSPEYAPLLCVLEKPKRFGGEAPPSPTMPTFQDDIRRRDVLHTNAVKILSKSLAPKFPMFKAGQLLISPRHLDALAVLDPDSGKITWAARGPWRAQHDPTFLDNGHLLLFDNYGSPQGSRALEYDPQTQGFPWSYPGDTGTPFFSKIRGMCQRLTNGNTLIVNSMGGEFFEVTPNREVVWSAHIGGIIYRARRYAPDQLHFLKGDPRARP